MRLAALAVALLPLAAAAQVSVSHTGYLLGPTDVPTSGTVPLTFGLYDDVTSGARVWPSAGEVTCNVTVANGFYAVDLGSTCGSGLSATTLNGARWLSVTVNGTTLSPRLPLAPLPVAALAGALFVETDAAAGKVLTSDAQGNGAWNYLTGASITDGSLSNADVSGSAAIATSKLAGSVTSITGHGLGALATLGEVTGATIQDGAIANADVSATAAIATSKLTGSVTSITGHGLGGLALLGAVGTGEITDGTITNADVSATAAIAGTKIAPNFGAQDVVTTGKVGIGGPSSGELLHVVGNNCCNGQTIQIGGYTALGEQHSSAAFVLGSNAKPANPPVDGMVYMTDGSPGFGARAIRMGASEGMTFHATTALGAAETPFSAERMRLTNGGRLGIGSTNPQSQLDVVGPNSATSGSGTIGLGAFTVRNNDTGGFNHLYIDRNFGSWQATPQLTLRADGNVGVNTASPAYSLDVPNGEVRAASYRLSYRPNTRIYANDNGCTSGGVPIATHSGITLCFVGQ